MTTQPKNLVILGATGSIGRSALEVVDGLPDQLRPVALSAHRGTEALLAAAVKYRPQAIVVTDAKAAKSQDWGNLPAETELLVGADKIEPVVQSDEVDTVLTAIVGAAGLRGTCAALSAGKLVALANKETLVMAGPLVMQLASDNNASIIPVDSEHSAIFQALKAGRRSEVQRVVLTASGGPFRTLSLEELKDVSVEQALAHPTWDMGPKITIDSATLMNKALEIIEARWLFDLSADEIEVMIHPQSVVHSLVEYVDGSVLAQMGPPDMRLPIQYALTYPDRMPSVADKFDWGQFHQLELIPPDLKRFDALNLGMEAARSGGTAGAVLNAANEAAVASFLDEAMSLAEIVPACRAVLENHHFSAEPDLDTLIQIDAWARQEIQRWVTS